MCWFFQLSAIPYHYLSAVMKEVSVACLVQLQFCALLLSMKSTSKILGVAMPSTLFTRSNPSLLYAIPLCSKPLVLGFGHGFLQGCSNWSCTATCRTSSYPLPEASTYSDTAGQLGFSPSESSSFLQVNELIDLLITTRPQ